MSIKKTHLGLSLPIVVLLASACSRRVASPGGMPTATPSPLSNPEGKGADGGGKTPTPTATPTPGVSPSPLQSPSTTPLPLTPTPTPPSDRGVGPYLPASSRAEDCKPVTGEEASSQWLFPNMDGEAQFKGTRWQWFDRECKPRRIFLTHSKDAVANVPRGTVGGYALELEWQDAQGKWQTAKAIGAQDEDGSDEGSYVGFGSAVFHFGTYRNPLGLGPFLGTRNRPGEEKVYFAGKHHVVHQYRWTLNFADSNAIPPDLRADYLKVLPKNPIVVTIQWLISTGRSEPIWAMSIDQSQIKAAPGSCSDETGKDMVGCFSFDSRSPYGTMRFPGDDGLGVVDEAAYGTSVKVKTTGDFNGKRYCTPWKSWLGNLVPFAWEQMKSVRKGVSAEGHLGLVQTNTWELSYSGSDTFGYHTEAPSSGRSLPKQWAYQMMMEAIPFDEVDGCDPALFSNSRRMTWKRPFATTSSNAFPQGESYATRVLFGPAGFEPVDSAMAEVESIHKSWHYKVVQGTQVSSVGRNLDGTGGALPFPVPSYNHTWGTFEVGATAGNQAALQFELSSQARDVPSLLSRPVLVVRNVTTGDLGVKWNGQLLKEGVDYWSSYDKDHGLFWVTLAQDQAKSFLIEVFPTPSPSGVKGR